MPLAILTDSAMSTILRCVAWAVDPAYVMELIMYTREQCYHISFVTNPILVALIAYWVVDWLWLRIYSESSAIYKWAFSIGVGHISAISIERNIVPVLIAAVITVLFTRSFWRSRIGQ